ncbi:MAG: hypothetical protein LBQ01_00385 [Prevotellaceae bacterium]|jgi:hypothetical protein|nr:hypothetical protein [Prevotellaceae bacterium]
MNKKTVRVNIYSDTDSIRVRTDRDTAQWYELPARVDVKRSRQELLITARKDTVQNKIRIKSRSSSDFILDILLTDGMGYFILRNNPKRYTYPKTVFIDLEHDKPVSYFPKPEKHLLNLKLSIPEGNHFYLNKGYKYGESFGFLGASYGFEYYFSDKYCINMDFGALTDFITPIPAAVSLPDGDYSRSHAIYGDLQAGSDYKRIHYDAGFQFTKTVYYERKTVERFSKYMDTVSYSKRQNQIGLALSSYLRLTKRFNIGLNYYPSFFVIENRKLHPHYSHLLFLEISFRIEVSRPSKIKIR